MSVLHNHYTAGIQWWQRPGAISNLDSMTVGRGIGYPGAKPGMSPGQYRIEVFHYAVLASPLVLSFDLATLDKPEQELTRSLILNKEIIQINQDRDVVPASLVYPLAPGDVDRNPWATNILIKPLSDGTFAVALVNKDPKVANLITVDLMTDFSGGPAGAQTGARVRDVYAQKDLGNITRWFNVTVPPMDARLLRFAIY